MNNTTRSLIFFAGLIGIVFYYFSILPLLPFALENSMFYVNYLAASLVLLFPTLQAVMRIFVLKKYKLSEDDALFFLEIHDSKIINRITFYAVAFLVILMPITGNKFDFSLLLPVHYFTFFIWAVVAEILLFISYKTTKAHFGKEYILIQGFDLRLDFPIGALLYSHSGVYYYQDFEYYYVEGRTIYMILYNNKGKVAVEVPENILGSVTGYLNAHKIKTFGNK